MSKGRRAGPALNGDQPLVSRASLVAALVGATGKPGVTLLVAPPLSGKRVLVSQFLAQLEARDGAWTEQRARDAAKRDEHALVLVSGFGQLAPKQQMAIGVRIEEAVARGGRFLIVSDTPLRHGFGRTKLSGKSASFGLADLAFQTEDVISFLGRSVAPDISALQSLQQKTEGWIGAWLHLRSLAAGGHAWNELARDYSGLDEDLSAYFAAEIMPRLSAPVSWMLSGYGALERVSAGMLDATIGKKGHQALLENAARECPFFLPVDRQHSEFRSHALFRSYLRSVAGDGTELEKVAAWAETQSNWFSAAKLYSEAGREEKAIEILGQHTAEIITARGEVLGYRKLLSGIPKDAKSEVASELAWGSIFTGDFAGAAGLLERLGPQLRAIPERERASFDAMQIAVDLGLDRFQQVCLAAPRWLAAHGQADPRVRSIVATTLFWACRAELDSAGLFSALEIARSETSRSQSPFLRSWLTVVTAIGHLDHGQMVEAEEALERSTRADPISETVDLVRAAVVWERGHADLARKLINRSLHQGTRHSTVETALMGWDVAARLAASTEGPDAALAMWRGAMPIIANRHGERGRILATVLMTKLALKLSAKVDLAALAFQIEAIADNAMSGRFGRDVVEAVRLVQARLQLRGGEAKQAIAILQPLLSVAQRQRRYAVWVEAAVLYAASLLNAGDEEKAIRMAWQAVERAAGTGMHDIVASERLALSRLCDALISRARLSEGRAGRAAQSIVSALAGREPAHMSASAERVEDAEAGSLAPGALTDAERRILVLVGQGFSNTEIAERMVVKLSTVKWHLQNIFTKLQVRSRTAALAAVKRAGTSA